MLMLAATAGLAAALPVTFGFAADQIITGIFLSVLFFLLFVLSLIHARADGSIAGNRAVDYTLIRNVYIVFCILTYGFSFSAGIYRTGRSGFCFSRSGFGTAPGTCREYLSEHSFVYYGTREFL